MHLLKLRHISSPATQTAPTGKTLSSTGTSRTAQFRRKTRRRLACKFSRRPSTRPPRRSLRRWRPATRRGWSQLQPSLGALRRWKAVQVGVGSGPLLFHFSCWFLLLGWGWWFNLSSSPPPSNSNSTMPLPLLSCPHGHPVSAPWLSSPRIDMYNDPSDSTWPSSSVPLLHGTEEWLYPFSISRLEYSGT